jgi:hypothetical protein
MALDLRAGNTVFVTPGELDGWLATAKVGDNIIYAVGTLTFKGGSSIELTTVARMTRTWSDQGKVDLVQRRRGVGSYEYIAIKRATEE